jgi:hypothetical protein
MTDRPPVVRASVEELKFRFNEAYLLKTLNGQFTLRDFGRQSLYQNPPAEERRYPPEPDGTITGLVEIIDPATNQRVAVAHRLKRPDGTFGASGYPDPKMVFVDGVIYIQKRSEGRTPQDAKLPSLFTDDGVG